jgi:V/A-type H+-transporting ATPase subunit K
MKNKMTVAWLWTAAGLLAACPAASAALAAAGEAPAAPGQGMKAVGLGFAAALTMAVCVMGSGYAVGRIGSAAMGAAAEKPELMIRSLLFVALAEGLAVLGFVIAMMLLQKI